MPHRKLGAKWGSQPDIDAGASPGDEGGMHLSQMRFLAARTPSRDWRMVLVLEFGRLVLRLIERTEVGCLPKAATLGRKQHAVVHLVKAVCL